MAEPESELELDLGRLEPTYLPSVAPSPPPTALSPPAALAARAPSPSFAAPSPAFAALW